MKEKAYAFFFDANHSELGLFYGPPCTSKIVSPALDIKLGVRSQILRGDLIPGLMAYKVSSVSKNKITTKGVGTIGRSMTPDMELYKLILCDFADSLSSVWHTVDILGFPFEMSKKIIWTIVFPTISQEAAEVIDACATTFGPYLGATLIDLGNPVHIRLFNLIDGAYIDQGMLYCRCDFDYEEGGSISESYGASSKPILVDSERFYRGSPPSLKMGPLSERGRLSVSRYEGKASLSHDQRLALAILDYLHKNPDVDGVSFNVREKSERPGFLCDENKLKNYLLNLDHPDGGPKARFFVESLGIKKEDWRYLSDQISGAMSTALIFRIKKNKYGINHGALIEIQGRNGRLAIINTGWMVGDDGCPRLITAYPHSEPVDKKLEAPPQNIVPPELDGAAKWAYIYRQAHEMGEKAAHSFIPAPMLLSGHSPIFEGLCGFAWVTIPDSRRGMAKWLKDNKIGGKNYKSGWDVQAQPVPHKNSHWDWQSIEPKKAYAEAFGKVLLDNGVECKVESRLD